MKRARVKFERMLPVYVRESRGYLLKKQIPVGHLGSCGGAGVQQEFYVIQLLRGF